MLGTSVLLICISRVANDLSSCDTAKYKISIYPSQLGNRRFHLGEAIQVQWQAPQGHSARDWIGIYRVGNPYLYQRVVVTIAPRSEPIDRR